MESKNMTKTEKIQRARREYLRRWRKRNPERIQQYREKFWLKKFEELQEDKGADFI